MITIVTNVFRLQRPTRGLLVYCKKGATYLFADENIHGKLKRLALKDFSNLWNIQMKT